MSVDLTRSNMLSTDPMYNKPIGVLQTEILRLREENEKLAMANCAANAKNEGLHIINQLIKVEAERGRLRDRTAGLAIDDFWAGQMSEERARADVIRVDAFRLRAELAATQALLEKERADARRADVDVKREREAHHSLSFCNRCQNRFDSTARLPRVHRCGATLCCKCWHKSVVDLGDGALQVYCYGCSEADSAEGLESLLPTNWALYAGL